MTTVKKQLNSASKLYLNSKDLKIPTISLTSKYLELNKLSKRKSWRSYVSKINHKTLIKKVLTQYKIRKAFSKFYYRHSELIVKYNIGLKTLLQQGISDPIFYGDLVYKFKRIVGKPNFSDQFKKIVKRYIRVGYNLVVMRQSACLVLNPIMVYSYGFLFNCTTVGQASDSMTALT